MEKPTRAQTKKIAVFVMIILMIPFSAAAATAPTPATIDYELDSGDIILNGQIVSDGAGTISEYGFYYARTADINNFSPDAIADDSDSHKEKAGAFIPQGQYFSTSLVGLEGDTEYLYFAYATNEQGTAYGAIKYFFTENDWDTPDVRTKGASVYYDEARLYGRITSDGGEAISEYGFYYGLDRNCSIQVVQGTSDIGESSFNAYLTNLSVYTTYYYQAYACNASGTPSYGSIFSFSTGDYYDYYDDDSYYYSYGKPTVSTKKPVDQAGGTVLYGVITSRGSASLTSYGFYWGTQNSPGNRVEVGSSIAANHTFSYQLNYLEPGEYYYVQTYASNSYGTTRGNAIRFKAGYNTQPTFTTLVSNIGSSEAIFSGKIGAVDGSRIREYGFIYGQVPGLESMVKVGYSIKRNKVFNYHASGLQKGALYYVKTYVITVSGVAYGPQVVFIAN
ncbi:MAG: hypothetical protein ABRQ26_12035 [Syntrophomonadaceae bacterium]